MAAASAHDRALFRYLLRLGDTAHVLCHRLGEWCGHGPVLEEDIALTNVALDLIGQARLYYQYAGEVEGEGRTEDDLAFLRPERDMNNLLLVEQPNGDFAQTIARQLFVDAWMLELYPRLTQSTDHKLAEIAARALKEARYHWRHSQTWTVRLGDGTEESHARMQRAVDELWMFTGELFADDDVDRAAAAEQIAPLPSALRSGWLARIRATLDEATLDVPGDEWMQSGGRQGQHSEHLGYILAEMQSLARAHPGAEW